MDVRIWFLMSNRPEAAVIKRRVKHVPASCFRSERVLQLFESGYQTGFRLMKKGRPTDSLRFMATLMGAELCQYEQLPADERRAFGEPGKWYLRGITDRTKSVMMQMGWQKHWIYYMLPGLMRKRIKGRVRYIAACPADWELGDDVYRGLYRW